MNVTNKTRLNMVIGHPLGHSKSPVLHNAVYQHLGIDAVLLAQPHLDINSLIHVIKTLNVALTAVTLPYKEKVISYLDKCSHEVNALQAANTIIQRDGKLHGYNTDIDGIAFALRHTVMQDKQVLIIGAGGAARAMGYFLKENNINPFWLNRTKARAMILAKKFGGEVIDRDNLNSINIDVIINATPVGLYPHTEASPLPDYNFYEHQTVFDMIYNPIMTHLLKEAAKGRANIISGLDMFIGQGLKQIELLTGNSINFLPFINTLKEKLI